MKDVFKIVSEKQKAGLCLIQMPTGSGKTHAILEFIYDYIKSHDDGKIIFITSMKKNLPENSLKKIFEKYGDGELFEKIFLFIDSKEQTVIDNYDEKMKTSIYKTISDKELASEFISIIKSIRTLQNNKDAESALKEKLNRTELRFRKEIHSGLTEFKTYGEKLKAVLEDPDWMWVSSLYPEVRTKECRVLFMSVDKFVMKNDPLVEKSYFVYDSELVKDSIVFIDEFDATKKTILNREIEMSVSRNLDYMRVAKQICEGMDNYDKHPREMYVLSKKMAAEESEPDTLISFAHSVSDRFNKVFKEYNLEYKFLMDMGPNASEFLFYGHMTHYITKGKDKFLTIDHDKDQCVNIIRNSDKKEDMFHFYDMFRDLSGAFRFFFSFVRKLALNCRYVQLERHTPIGYEYCIASVLEVFDLDSDTVDYFIPEILTMRSSREKRGAVTDESVYERGFCVYNMKNGNDHVYNSRIKMISHNIMPERILIGVCNNALVFGVSATATMDTVTGNYDLKYIKSRLKEKFIELDEGLRARLREEFKKSISRYDEVEIKVEPVSSCAGGGKYDANIWNTICPDKLCVEYIRNLLDRKGYDDFRKARYLRIAIVYHKFLTNDNIFSLLCFLNRHPTENSADLDRKTLKDIFINISNQFESKLPDGFSNESVFYLSGDDYDHSKDELLKKLGDKKKMFVITAYGTLGAGQNIQYPVKSLEGLVRINDFSLITESEEGRPLEKDFDAIYLDCPTNVIPFATENKKTKDIIEQIAITESLYERGEITGADEKKCIESAFSYIEYEINRCKGICIETVSAKNHAAVQVIQAIGRICRTILKNPTIYIFADEKLQSIFNKHPDYYGELVNRETKELIEYFSTPREDGRFIEKLIGKALHRSRRAIRYINRLKSGSWDEDKISKWESLREHVLKHPTSSDFFDEVAYQFYAEVPKGHDRFWYSTDNDFKTIEISFDKNLNNAESVSEESARLAELMQIPEIKDMFKKEGYATSFSDCHLMLPPPLFKNIYKGALGEIVGKKIITVRCSMSLVPLDVIEYEKFDFRTEDGRFYFDFKHWGSADFVEQSVIDEIFEKMVKIGAKRVFVVNILKPKFDCDKEVRSQERGDFKLIEVPYLFDPERGQWNEEAIFGINKEVESWVEEK